MFKDFVKFFKSDNAKWVFVVVVVLLIIWALMSYSNTKNLVKDAMQMQNAASVKPYAQTDLDGQEQAASVDDYKKPMAKEVPATAGASGYQLQPVANPKELLPKDQNSQWAALNPVNNSEPITPDLLQAGNLIGLDTIGQTLKNANLQLRSDPVIEKQNVGPWNNSTYEADLARVPLELGCTVGK
jgi:hypothetical protein